jgi:PAS domain S-box-containing protein
MLLFGIILVVIALSAIITSQRVEKAGNQERIAAGIAQGASELSYLANDYLIYRESQQLKRWQSRFTSFSGQVAGLNVDEFGQQALVRNIQGNQHRLKEVFDSVVSAVGNLSPKQKAALDPAFLQVSWSRMAVQSQGLVSDASRLSQLLHQEIDRLREARSWLLYMMVGLFGAFLLAGYMLTYRRILKSIGTLQAGAKVIGSGNLDFRIEEKRNDEIGDLSHSFNRMTSDLKAITASKADLEREIAERKRAEEELRQQREWLQVTLTSIGDAVIATDTQCRISFLNPIAAALTGWPVEEALGRPVQDLFRIINEKTGEPGEDIVGCLLREGRNVALANHTALVARDGREVPIEDSAAPIKDRAGKVAGVVLVFHDVTEKRRAVEALRESETKYRTLFENMAEEVHFWELVRDETGRIKTWRLVDVNPPTLKSWGRTSVHEIRGKTADEIFGPGATEHYMPVVQKIMTEAVPNSFEDYFPNLDRHFRFTSVPLGDFFITTGADITDIKKAEESLRARNEELTRLNNAMVGRELRMIELKKEVNELCARAGERRRYREDFE